MFSQVLGCVRWVRACEKGSGSAFDDDEKVGRRAFRYGDAELLSLVAFQRMADLEVLKGRGFQSVGERRKAKGKMREPDDDKLGICVSAAGERETKQPTGSAGARSRAKTALPASLRCNGHVFLH